MGRKELAVLGGLLSGIGEGMMSQDTKRMEEERTKRLEIIAGFKNDQKGLLTDKQMIDTIFKANTTKGGGLEGDSVNHMNIIAILEKEGRKDLADLIRQGDKPLDMDSDEYLAADKQAEKEANERDPIGINKWREEATNEAFDGKGRERWKYDRTLEILGAGGTPSSMGMATSIEPAPGTSGIIPISRGGDAKGDYKTTAEVGAAYLAGKISAAEAEKIIREQFGST